MNTALLAAFLLDAVAVALFVVVFARTKALDALAWALVAGALAILWFSQLT